MLYVVKSEKWKTLLASKYVHYSALGAIKNVW